MAVLLVDVIIARSTVHKGARVKILSTEARNLVERTVQRTLAVAGGGLVSLEASLGVQQMLRNGPGVPIASTLKGCDVQQKSRSRPT